MAPARKAQTRLQLASLPLSSSSPSKEEYSPSVQDRLANVRFKGGEARLLQKREVASIPTPEPSSQPHPASWEGDKAAISQNDEDDDIESPATKRRRTTSSRPRQTTLTPRRSCRFQDHASTHIRPSSSASSSSSQRLHSIEIPSPTPTRRTRSVRLEKAPLQSSPPPQSSTGLSDLGSPETTGDDDDAIATRPTVQRRRPRKSFAAEDDFIVPDHENIAPSIDEDDVLIAPSKPRESTLVNHTPRSRRLKSRREHRELKEDLEELQDSDSPQLQSSRTRGAPVNKEWKRRREYIERLKRRRAGEIEPIQVDTDEDGQPVDIDCIANYTPNASRGFFAQRSNAYMEKSSSEDDEVLQDPTLDIDEDDFVVSDEEEPSSNRLGRPHPNIPLEFTSYASAKPRELFVHVIEWLVKNKIAPAFSRHDPLWKLAFTKIQDETTAQAGSRLKSSAWTGPFMNALNARPSLSTRELDPGENFMRGCDACNRTNHPATYGFVFSGSAYHHDSLEPVDPDSSEAEIETETNHDNASVDSRGHALPDISTQFFLGRYCAANAELAHKFTHWKHNLNEDLIRYLESQGLLSAEEIVRRERSTGGQRKREKEAEETVDQMKAIGVIDELWKGFKNDLEDARIGMEGHEKRGGRGRGRIGSVRVPTVSDLLRVEDPGVERAFGVDSDRETVKTQAKLFASDDEGE